MFLLKRPSDPICGADANLLPRSMPVFKIAGRKFPKPVLATTRSLHGCMNASFFKGDDWEKSRL